MTETIRKESKYPVPTLRVAFISMTNKERVFAIAEKERKDSPKPTNNLPKQKLPLFYEHKIKARKYDLF